MEANKEGYDSARGYGADIRTDSVALYSISLDLDGKEMGRDVGELERVGDVG